MTSWMPKPESLKWYPHFDAYLPPNQAGALATDAKRVARHAFFPLLRYVKAWQPFRTATTRGSLKERPIRYAARADAYIYAYYRALLSELYEAELARLGISTCPIAYRKIPVSANSSSGKCNIHFAKDAFEDVIRLGNCTAVALDISKFFEHLDHDILKDVWCRMLGSRILPDDHFAVYRSVTSYAFAERDDVYRRLGYLVERNIGGKKTEVYSKPFKEMPLQLCSPLDFRLKIAGKGGVHSSLIRKNSERYGIPQGTPLSDLLANMYLIDFDVAMNEYARKNGGKYYRYSDDIIIILPGGNSEGLKAEKFAQSQIKIAGPRLLIKSEKTTMVTFTSTCSGLRYEIPGGYQNKNGLEYLGFRFDGKFVYLRDSTLSNLQRKMAKVMYHECMAHVRRYRDRGISELISSFNLDPVISKFSRVEDFEKYADSKNNWTFWTYARRSSEVFGILGRSIPLQLQRHKLNFQVLLHEKMKVANDRLKS
jgi:hypothetical protein